MKTFWKLTDETGVVALVFTEAKADLYIAAYPGTQKEERPFEEYDDARKECLDTYSPTKKAGLYILDKDRKAVPVDSVKEWGEYMSWGNKWREHCQVGLYQGPEGSVSTVFLGMDHSWDGPPPILFETMANGDVVERYPTWELAEQGHQKYVEKLKEAYNGATNDGTSS